VIDLILVGNEIDLEYLARKVIQAGELVGRKVSYVVLDPAEADTHLLKLNPDDLLPLWNSEKSKLMLHHPASTG